MASRSQLNGCPRNWPGSAWQHSAAESSQSRHVGSSERLYGEVSQQDVVAVTAGEDAHAAVGQCRIFITGDLRTVHEEIQPGALGLRHQFVEASVRMHSR